MESGVLEDMIGAFLKSSEELKQTTFMQILSIAEQITAKDKNGKSICKMLFMTLKSTDCTTQNHEDVNFLVCQGLLDILVYGVCQDVPNTRQMCSETGTQAILCRLDTEDTAELFVQTACFMTSCLNIGNFEGISGAKQHVVIKL